MAKRQIPGKLRFTHSLIVRLGRLLHMEYRPSELAEELHIDVDAVYRIYIPAGCPHRRDDTGHIWIVGTEFANWARTESKRDKLPMKDGEAYCLKCNKVVNMGGELTSKPSNHYLELVKGKCPTCGTVVNRARARKDRRTR